jgi:hypothetical protein
LSDQRTVRKSSSEIEQAGLRLESKMAELKVSLLKWLVPLLTVQLLLELGIMAKLIWP